MGATKWLNQLKIKAPIPLAMLVGAAALVGGVWLALRQSALQPADPSQSPPTLSTPPLESPSAFIQQLALVPADQRRSHLSELAQANRSQETHQARLMLAADWVEAEQGAAALDLLDGLETHYPLLASEILVLRAKALTQVGNADAARRTWEQILQDYPQDPAVVEALYSLGQNNPQLWTQARQTFPSHPLSVAIAQAQLKRDPNSKELLLHLARHGLHLANLKTYLERLTQQHGKTLQAEDWHAIGFAYWEKLAYKEAGEAYARAPQSALTLYRSGRGLQIGGEKELAIAQYKRLIQAYPQAKETIRAYLQLGSLVDPPDQRLPYLDQALQLAEDLKRPSLAAEALLAKAKLQKQINQSAQATERTLLKTYGQTPSAADLLWERAQAQAKAGNYAAARENSWRIAQTARKTAIAPKAAFWTGKWSQKLNQPERQQEAFQALWQYHPDSYYAWRAASLSGWPVGDFQTVRTLAPQPNWPQQQLPLATGSQALRALYTLGLYRQAWKRWLVEFQSREQPSFAQQQTDGLIRNGVGEYLDGIFMLNNLDDRLEDEPEQTQTYEQWRAHPGFWSAIYPLAYYPETASWAKQVNLNPLLALGLMRQESRFQPQIRSVAGAVGLMQVMPETGQWIASQLQEDPVNLEIPDDNIRYGTWYLDYTHRSYGNNAMLAIASYNAGPGNVEAWIKEYQGLDPDEFIEAIPFSETRNYVTAVLENHWNYLRLYDPNYANLLTESSS
ncbi:lytic transglycosylase domain-containing protein [Lyngbya confervoides]|uniref:Lytic transglycosylase domain-containing protein n=1 Tax=Lyngbya confervoides BDU141951 TaxID=1574623 RepID=A0ABD4T3Q3_9CYAN|nr:lytic transglycosylase domain-containing protein [Lyngbya confervoides]MCM1983304.1 lytic transglycosylase domain-containing protein [Lyngbya confervoides BDU141951]